MTEEFNKAVNELIKDIQKQLGNENPVAKYVTSAVLAKMTKDKMKEFIK